MPLYVRGYLVGVYPLNLAKGQSPTLHRNTAHKNAIFLGIVIAPHTDDAIAIMRPERAATGDRAKPQMNRVDPLRALCYHSSQVSLGVI